MNSKEFGNTISIKEVSKEELQKIHAAHFLPTFENRIDSPVNYRPSETAKQQIKERKSRDLRYELRFAVYRGSTVIGWHYGYSTDPETYFMQNSAVLSEFRNQGIYTKLLDIILAKLQDDGFQVVTSNHHPNNAAVLIPKLKKGFVVSSMQFHERFRFLIELKYFFDENRRREFGKNLGLDL
ncbi:MAG TPA: GNAT family N-acetyltransferase [Bdellovibrio sp.]|nr:GNAT family N-acetyltransferase [Bdellovibrio sp.]